MRIDLANLRANAQAVRDAAESALLPVVKADAYGLGAVRVARALEALDPWGFAVATVDEAVALRAAGLRWPVLVFTPASLGLEAVYREHDLRAVLDDPDAVTHWDVPFHLEIDSGMGRCGVRWDDPDAIGACNSPRLEGAFTHCYAADRDAESVQEQWTRFARALRALSPRPPLVHVANSAAAWRLKQRLDLIRPGIYLYGGEHAPDLPHALPVVSVRAPVVSVRRMPAGSTVSYGGDWVAPRDTVVATLGIGYADGVPRSVQGRAHVLVNGDRRPVVGRVTMDFIMIDLGEAQPTVRVGDLVTVIGQEGPDTITIDEFASWGGTIAYEALVRLGARMGREYVGV